MYISMCVCIFPPWDVCFFSCACFPTQPSFCGGICYGVSERYWFIMSDSCDIHPYYSPLRTCFQSLLEVEPEKNYTDKMISGLNFNGNCSLFLYSIIFFFLETIPECLVSGRNHYQINIISSLY